MSSSLRVAAFWGRTFGGTRGGDDSKPIRSVRAAMSGE